MRIEHVGFTIVVLIAYNGLWKALGHGKSTYDKNYK